MVEPAGEAACRVTDTLVWRAGGPAPSAALLSPALRMLLAWRHHRLRRSFGRAPVTVLFDGDCGFCRWSLERLFSWDRRDLVRAVAIQTPEGRALTPRMAEDERLASAHAVTCDGRVASGGAAFAAVADVLPAGAPLAALARRFPDATEHAYRFVADRRSIWGRFLRA